MTTTRNRVLTGLAGLALAGAALTACGGNSNDNAGSNTDAAATQSDTASASTTDSAEQTEQTSASGETGATTSSSATTGSQAGSTSDAQTSAGDQLGVPFASRTAAVGYIGQNGIARVDVYPIKRTASTTTLNLKVTAVRVTSPASGSEAPYLLLGGVFNDGNLDTGGRGTSAPDGFQLVDSVGKQAYLVGSSAPGRCLCTPEDLGVRSHLGKGESLMVSATFAAPPASVKTMNVIIPSFGTVANVPVQ